MAVEVILYVGLAVVLHFVIEYLRRKPKLDNISSKSVLITGCDTGFGKLLATRLDGLGCQVFAACYTQRAVEELRSCSSSRLETVLLDVTKTESIQKAQEFVTERLGQTQGLWGLVNNAGIIGSAYAPLEYLTKGDLQEVLDVNVLGMVDMTVHFLPLLTKAKGRIVNTASVAGRLAAAPNLLSYNVSKYGVEALSDGIRPHMKKYGCHVSVIEPGVFATNMTDVNVSKHRIKGAYDRMSSEDQEALGSDYVDKTFINLKKNMKKSANQNVDEVVDAYQHALFAVNPKKRYSCGWETKYILIPLSYMPSWLHDLICPGFTQNLYPMADLTKFKT